MNGPVPRPVPSPAAPAPAGKRPWWRLLDRYQWTVFILASLGWMFDTMDQQIFTMSRSISMRDLVPDGDLNLQNQFGGYATTCFILGWATGGLIFGVIGDVWGRAKTMALTILIYAAFTGLSALSTSWMDFSLYRFLSGLGVGGEFAVGVAIIAEVMPDAARSPALGALQALSAVGNVTAGVLIGYKDALGGWRHLYYVGALPALLAGVVIFRLKEPQRWVEARAALKSNPGQLRPRGRLRELFGHPRWRKHAIIGLCLAVAGVFGLWGVGFWSGELIDSALPTMAASTQRAFSQIVVAPSAAEQSALIAKLSPGDLRAYLNLFKYTMPAGMKYDPNQAKTGALSERQKQKMSTLLNKALEPQEEPLLKRKAFVLQQIGGFLGVTFVSFLAGRLGRRLALAIALLSGFLGAEFVFYIFSDRTQIIYLWPLLGFCTLMPFGGFAIYFPELFPTSLRSTGTSFCYNVGRYITAFGPILLPRLAMRLHGRYELPGFRVAALWLCLAYFIGLIALIWAPETIHLPLPEEESAPAG